MPLLGWFKSLESLVIIPRGIIEFFNLFARNNDPNITYPLESDPFVVELLHWMSLDPELLPKCLRRFWINEDSVRDSVKTRSFSIEHFIAPSVKALHLWPGDKVHTKLDHPKFSQLEHLSGFNFSNSLAQMTQLKFAYGDCVNDNVIISLISSYD